MRRARIFIPVLYALAACGCSMHQADHQQYDSVQSLTKAAQEPSPEQEYYLGRAVAAQILTHYSLYKNSALTDYLNSVGRAVVASSDLPDTFGGYHVAVLDTEEITAVSAPGGLIFISRGMLRRIPNEDVLAAVLAHEVTHVAHHHGIKSISKNSLRDELVGAGIAASALSCNEAFVQGAVAFSAIADDIAETLIEKGYDRKMEYEADAGSVQILTNAGFQPDAIVAMLRELEKLETTSSGGWFKTHPAPEDRIVEVAKLVKAKPADDFFRTGQPLREKRFKLAMKNL